MSTNPEISNLSESPIAIPQARRPKMPSQVPVLLLILAVSVGALWGMRSYGMRSGFKFTEVPVDFKEDDSAKARSYERIMADLARVQNPLDVTLTEFGKSPFMRERPQALITPEAGPIEPNMSDADRHRAECVDALKRMKLRGIIGNVARIDDLTVRKGDQIDMFTVTGVDGRTVTFEAYGEVFTLTLDTPKPNSQKKAPTRMGNAPAGR